VNRPARRAAVTVAALLAFPVNATSWNWADDPAALAPHYAGSVAICERVRDLQPPAIDHADASLAPTLEGCDSEALYYGIGMPADPVRARQCALLESAGEGEGDARHSAFGGQAMLMTIYANGVGAERYLDLATAMACRIHGAPFEVAGRVHHLQELKSAPEPGADFGFCDHVTSGAGMATCARHRARVLEARRARRLAELGEGWDQDTQAAFGPLLEAAGAFAGASAGNEVDLSGSGRWAFVAQREQQLLEAFVALLATLESDSLPRATEAEHAIADERLNAIYRQVMDLQPQDGARSRSDDGAGRIGDGTVTKGGVREAQRAWLAYRDAWLAFAAKHYSQQGDSVATWLTRQRADDLAKHLPQPM
jgi:uncharacterized protein YecT (DUF1311 family)